MQASSQPYSTARQALIPFLPRSLAGARREPWPLPVEAPLTHLDEALAQGQPGIAVAKIREIAEGAVRVAYTAFVYETFALLRIPECARRLGDARRQAVRSLFRQLDGRRFSFGPAVSLLAAKTRHPEPPSPLAVLAPALQRAKPDCFSIDWLDAQQRDSKIAAALRWLVTWRNKVYAHGTVGSPDRYARLFDRRALGSAGWTATLPRKAASDASPLPALLVFLRALRPWLAASGRKVTEWGWPTLEDSKRWRETATLMPNPGLIAYRGGARPLYLLDHIERDKLVLFDVISGEEDQRLPFSATDRALMRAYSPCRRSQSPLGIGTIDDGGFSTMYTHAEPYGVSSSVRW